MEYITTTLGNLVHQTAFFSLTWGNVVMIAVACFFLYLAIKHGFEPLLLVPIAFGMLLVNIYPDIMLHAEDAANGTGGLLYYFYKLDEWSILPSLIFMGVGAMTDFGPLIANPKSFLLGASAQFGIFAAYLGAMAMGFSDKAAAAISIIGGADGPTSIFLAGKLQHQQSGFVGFFPWEMFTTKVTVCSGFFVDWVQQIQHLNQAVWTQVEELAHQQRQLF